MQAMLMEKFEIDTNAIRENCHGIVSKWGEGLIQRKCNVIVMIAETRD